MRSYNLGLAMCFERELKMGTGMLFGRGRIYVVEDRTTIWSVRTTCLQSIYGCAVRKDVQRSHKPETTNKERPNKQSLVRIFST